MAQLQHNMWGTNAKEAVLSIITGGGKWVEITPSADALYQHLLITAERDTRGLLHPCRAVVQAHAVLHGVRWRQRRVELPLHCPLHRQRSGVFSLPSAGRPRASGS